jgi:glutamate 5-kinase
VTEDRAELARRAKRVVLKVGSGALSGGGRGLDAATLARLASDLARARELGRQTVVVSSGAILAGLERLGLPKAGTIQLKQAAAAVGQSRLMAAWSEALAPHGLAPAQVLLTQDDFRHRERYLNARNTMLALLELGAVPVVNENDTVAVEEIRFGENDMLAALVAGLVDADLLVILTDQEGLYTSDPRKDKEARLVEVVHPDRPAEFAAGKQGPRGSGGMEAKVRAAGRAAAAGVPAILASGFLDAPLSRVLAGEALGTLFVRAKEPLSKRKQWLAFAAHPKGQIEVDEGAKAALTLRAKSLLPSGVKSVRRDFKAGDVVSLTHGGAEFARGLANYSSEEIGKIKGLRTSQLEAILGQKTCDEVIHRDNLVLLK